MQKGIFLFCLILKAMTIYSPVVTGQSTISNLAFSVCFSGSSEGKTVTELTVTFEIKNANDIQFVYLHYADRNSEDSKAKFLLLDFIKYPEFEKKQGFDKVYIREEKFAKGIVKDINFIRVYISDKNGNYSNELLFGE